MAKGTIGLGQYRGKVGGQVLRVVDGKQVMQSYQPVVRNPRTSAQMMQRAALRVLGQAARALLSVLRVSFGGPYATGAFIKANIGKNSGALQNVTDTSAQINFAGIHLTKDNAGGLLEAQPGSVDYGTSHHLQVVIPIASVAIAQGIDADDVRVYGIVWNPERGVAMLSDAAATTASNVEVEVPANWDGMEVHTWLFATAAMNDSDPDAWNRTDQRLPYIVSGAWYAGSGEVE